MSTAVSTQAAKPAATDKPVEYIPLGAKNPVSLTVNIIRKFLCTPTWKGNLPQDADIMKFMMLCKARELDPWVGDAYLVGYETKNDGPQWSLITAAQALLKRAEISPEYNGMESGVIVENAEKVVEYRQGDMVFNGENLIGGWAKVFRRDHEHPAYDSLRLDTYSTGKSRWEKDPAGMIVKCAEASALRKSFPTQLGGLYSREEMEHLSEQRIESRVAGNAMPIKTASNLDELAGHIEQQVTAPQQQPHRIENQAEQPKSLSSDEPPADFESTAVDPKLAIAAEFDNAKSKSAADALKVMYIGAAYPPEIREHADVCHELTMKRLEREAKKPKPGTQKELGE